MAKQRLIVKSFVYFKYLTKPQGAPPHVWEVVPDEQTKQVTLDTQIEDYLQRSGLELVSAQAPTSHATFLDAERQVQQVIFVTNITCRAT